MAARAVHLGALLEEVTVLSGDEESDRRGDFRTGICTTHKKGENRPLLCVLLLGSETVGN